MHECAQRSRGTTYGDVRIASQHGAAGVTAWVATRLYTGLVIGMFSRVPSPCGGIAAGDDGRDSDCACTDCASLGIPADGMPGDHARLATILRIAFAQG